MKLNEIKDLIQKFLKENEIKNYKINPDGTVDVNGDVIISTKQSNLPVKFGKVTGYFDCNFCNLISLEGAPSYVGSYFGCGSNNITSLEGAPSYVGTYFGCSQNPLTSLHDVHKHIKEINGKFYCTNNNNPIKDSVLGLFMIKGIKAVYLDNKEVQKIINKHIEQGRAGIFDAQQELLDAGLDEYARL